MSTRDSINNASFAKNQQHHQHPNDHPEANLPPAVDDLHRIFPEIPPNEKAIRNFPCSHLVRKFMCVGRLYLTPIRLCFIGLLSSNVTFEWTNVSLLDKKSSLLFDSIELKVKNVSGDGAQLPNSPSPGVANSTDVCFTGFVNGSEEPYQVMKTLWNVKRSFGGGQPHPAAVVVQQQQQQQMKSSTPASPAGAGHSRGPSGTTTEALAASGSTPPKPVNAGSSSSSAALAEMLVENLPPQPDSEQQQDPASPGAAAGPNDRSQSRTSAPITPRQKGGGVGGGGGTGSAVPSMDSLPGDGGPSAAELGIDMPSQHQPQQQPTSVARTPTVKSPSATPTHSRPGTPASPQPQQQEAAGGGGGGGGGQPNALERTCTPANAGGAAFPASAEGSSPVSSPKMNHNAAAAALAPSAGMDDEAPPPMAQPPLPGNTTDSTENAAKHSKGGGAGGEHHHEQIAEINPNDLGSRFPGVPKTERILDSFQCSFIAGVHRYGRMAVTRNFILFSSVVSSPVVIKLAEVETLTKQTNLVILDGFCVNMKEKGVKYEFTSFAGTRDKCYSLICDLVRSQAQVNAALGIGDKPSQATLDLGRGDEEDEETPRPRTKKGDHGDDDDDEEDDEENENNEDVKSDTAPPSPAGGAPAASVSASSGKEEVNNKLRFATSVVTPDPSTWTNVGDNIDQFDTLLPHGWGTQALSPPSKLMETVLLDNMDLPPECTLSDVYRVLFDDNVQFAIEYRENRPPVPDRDTKIEPWKKSPGGTGGTRRMDCTATIRALSVVVCPYHEFQRFLLCTWKGKQTLVVQFSGQAVGAMFSDTFRAETMMIFQPQGADGKTHVSCTVYFHILYISAPFMIKGKIKTNAFAECQDSYRMFFKIANKYMKEDIASPNGIAPRPAGSKKTGGKKGKKGAGAADAAGGGGGAEAGASPVAISSGVAIAPTTAGGPAAAGGAVDRNMHLDIARKAFLVLTALYAVRAQFSLWWSAPENPSEMPNFTAWNHLLCAVSCALLAYVMNELSIALAGMF